MADPEEVPAGGGYAAAPHALDPAEMLESVGALFNPVAAAWQMPWLAGEMIK